MKFDQVNKELFSFLNQSPNAFFAVKNMCDAFRQAGMRAHPGILLRAEDTMSPEMIPPSSPSGSPRLTTRDFR